VGYERYYGNIGRTSKGFSFPWLTAALVGLTVKTAEVRDNVGIGVEILAKSAWLTISAK